MHIVDEATHYAPVQSIGGPVRTAVDLRRSLPTPTPITRPPNAPPRQAKDIAAKADVLLREAADNVGRLRPIWTRHRALPPRAMLRSHQGATNGHRAVSHASTAPGGHGSPECR